MTEHSDTPLVVRNPIEQPQDIPQHKKIFDEFIAEAVHSSYILDYLFQCYPDLRLSPSNVDGSEQALRVEIDHGSKLAEEIDWLGGNFCNEKISFTVEPDGSLHRVIEIFPKKNPRKINSRYIHANLGTGKAREFTNYVMDEPWENLEDILPFLEIDDEERQEIANLHRGFRHKYFVANSALAQSPAIGDSSD